MTHCDCTHVARRSNRVWTTTCVVLSLFALGCGFILGQLTSL